MDTIYYPRPPVLADKALAKGHAVIEASAGTGKTYTLEHLVLDLIIEAGAGIEEILVVTFTDAATRELRERVRSLIRRISDQSTPERPERSRENCWEISESTRVRLREALFRFDGAAISTIHGFCQRILSEQAFHGGRLFEQKHADGSEMFGLAFREELRHLLSEESTTGEVLRIWLEQGGALNDLQEFLYLCHREGCPERCPVTPLWDPGGFKKAMDELPDIEDLKNAALTLHPDKRTANAFKSLFERLSAALEAMQNAVTEQEKLIIFTSWAFEKKRINKIDLKQVEHIQKAAELEEGADQIARAATALEKMILRAASGESFFVYQVLPRVQKRLSARKSALGLIDYDDMLLGVLEALKGPGGAVLLNSLRKRWKFALVDEFQDTDPVQWEIFRRIFVDGTTEHRLIVIGDPKQAIYGFRGADVHTYEIAKKHLATSGGAKRLPLLESYRSTEKLIEALNNIFCIKDPTGRTFFSGLNSYEVPVQCGSSSLPAVEGGKEAVPVHLVHLYNDTDRLNAGAVRQGLSGFIAEEIKKLVDGKNGLVTESSKGEGGPISYSDIYILTRSGQEGRQIGTALRRHGIPHAFYKQEGLFQTSEAEELHSLLRAIASPGDPDVRMSAWLTPFFGLSLDELPDWKNAGENHLLVTRLFRWKRLADNRNWTRFFEAILKESGLVRRLVFSVGERSLTNYMHLFELLQAEAQSNPVTLSELNRSLKARIDKRELPEGREGDIQRLETDKAAVQILTMHKAKGLEAEVVFIAGGFTNPSDRGTIKTKIYHLDNRRHLHIGSASGFTREAIEREIDEENQRLAYVAMTRAKSRLYLPYFGPAPPGAPEKRGYNFSRLGRFYKNIQQQLDLLREHGILDDNSLYAIRETSCRQLITHGESEKADIKWQPGSKLLEMPPPSSSDIAAIEPYHRGILLTSYTRIKQGEHWHPPLADEENQAVWRGEEVAGEAWSAGNVYPEMVSIKEEMVESPELPGGRETGTFLHFLFENTPAEEIRQKTLADWTSLETVQQRAKRAVRRHGLNENIIPLALELVYRALRTPVIARSMEENEVLQIGGGIAQAKEQRAEMAFIYPIPEEYHPLLEAGLNALSRGESPLYHVGRGYLQGLIDLVFEHDHKIYLLDWKSDRLDSFDRNSINEHVALNYSLQARVYTLAVLRMLGIRGSEDYNKLFGGLLYQFVRGIKAAEGEDDSEGTWFSRPSWETITKWEKDFIVSNNWGGSVLEAKFPAAKEERI